MYGGAANERIYRDLDGKKITKHIAYKEIMVFSQLMERDMFGGRVMCTKSHQPAAVQEKEGSNAEA